VLLKDMLALMQRRADAIQRAAADLGQALQARGDL